MLQAAGYLICQQPPSNTRITAISLGCGVVVDRSESS
jgi:hypothetical protein